MLTIDGRGRTIAAIVALVAAIGSLALLAGQVEVTDGTVGATRTCGSALDSAIDRSGWDRWWASDLDEPDPAVRDALVRTQRCPDAVNGRLALVAALAATTGGALFVGQPRRPQRSADGASVGRRVARLGRAATWTGAGLTLAGAIAVVVLVGDADSTLFLYTDRLVVAVVGLLVLTPTIAVFVIGRALSILGRHLDATSTEPNDA